MPDREIVLKGLEICEKKDCALCPYTDWCGDYDDSYYDCTKLLAKDALALLKEQEAVEPTWSRGKPFCGACGLRIHGGKFCGECGKPILWKGR